MRCLTSRECEDWLKPASISIDAYGRATLPYTTPRSIYALIAADTHAPEVARRVMDWLPAGADRLIFISEHEFYPPDQPIVFEAIRRGGGATSELAETPGHLFSSTKSADTLYDDRAELDVREESVAMWLGGLALEWTWLGFVAAQGCGDVVQLGDGYLLFESPSHERLQAADALCQELGLKVLDRFPWQ